MDFDRYNALLSEVLSSHNLYHEYILDTKTLRYSHVIYQQVPVPYSFKLLTQKKMVAEFVSEPPYISHPGFSSVRVVGKLKIKILNPNSNTIDVLTVMAVTQQILEALGTPSTDIQDLLPISPDYHQ